MIIMPRWLSRIAWAAILLVLLVTGAMEWGMTAVATGTVVTGVSFVVLYAVMMLWVNRR